MVKKIFGQCYIWLILLLVYLPVFILIVFSFTNSKNVGDWQGFSTVLYNNLFTGPDAEEIWKAVGNTAIIAVTSAIVATLLGATGAVGAFYLSKRKNKAFNFVNQIPIVNAEIVMGLSLAIMFAAIPSALWKVDLRSYWTLLIGHVVLSAPFVYISVVPKLVQMDPALYEAAIDLGATPRQALNKIIIPEIMPGVASGFLLAITLSLDDVIITEFTRGAGLLSGDNKIETLSTLVQNKIKKGAVPPELRPLTTIIFCIVVGVVISVSVYRLVKAKQIKKKRAHEF